MNYKDLPLGEDSPEIVNTIIEITKGQHNKYEYDPELGIFMLDRVLHTSMFYPSDYGFLPQTLAEDGDPLDMLVLVENPTFSGCLIPTRPIGFLEMIDNGEEDQKLIGVASKDPKMKSINEISDIQPFVLEQIAHFFETYKQLEGKEVKIGDWKDRQAAYELIKQTHENYKNNK